MSTFDDTVWQKCFNSAVAQVGLSNHPDGANFLYGPGAPDPNRVFKFGDVIVQTVLPIAIVAPADSDATQERTTGVVEHTWPFDVKVIFDVNSGATPADLSKVHSDLFQATHEAFHRTELLRTLGGNARVVRYIGGGESLTPEDVEAEPDSPSRFSFTMSFEAIYRHRDTDATVQV